MSALKDIYSPEFYNRFSNTLLQVLPDFDKNIFMEKIFTPAFSSMELKERMRHTTKVLHEFLPENFNEAFSIIEKLIAKLRENYGNGESLAYIFLPDYIEIYGINDYENSVKALEFTTQFISCEFGIRPFLIKYPEMLAQMKVWSKHESPKVRRLASEGSRSKLPWAMAVPDLKKNPDLVIEILENLKADSSEYVRRSVANNLNDIAKDHPAKVLEIARSWKGISKETDAIVKHGARTLLKQGHPEILKIYGLDSKNIEVSNFEIHTPKVKIGDSLEFSFTVKNDNNNSQIVRLEYGIYYKKSKGHLAKKVFKISEKEYPANEIINIRRKQSFKIITTRIFYAGMHQLSIIVNGEEKTLKDFEIEF